MKILITGIAGFIGSKLAKSFQKSGHTIIGIDDLSTGYKKNLPPNVIFYKFNVADKKKLFKLKGNFDQIFHCAGQTSVEKSFEDPLIDLNGNLISTINIINFGIQRNVKKLIFASSVTAYGNQSNKKIKEENVLLPLTCYGASKVAAENYIKIFSNKLPYVILRLNNVYGHGQDMNNLKQGMISIYLSQALKKNNIEVKGSTERYRDFIYVEDVVNIWKIISRKKTIKNMTFNVGTGKKTKVKTVLSLIKNNFKGLKTYVTSPTRGDQFGNQVDISKLKKKLNYKKFINLKSGLKQFIFDARNSRVK